MSVFPVLNFDLDLDVKTVQENNTTKSWDAFRQKYVKLTPEEWVRQHVAHYLLKKNYPKPLIALEKKLTVNGLTKRFDILVFDSRNHPFLLAECKSPDVQIDEKTLNQVLNYNRQLKAPYLMITNGLTHYYLHINDKEINFIPNLPDFETG